MHLLSHSISNSYWNISLVFWNILPNLAYMDVCLCLLSNTSLIFHLVSALWADTQHLYAPPCQNKHAISLNHNSLAFLEFNLFVNKLWFLTCTENVSLSSTVIQEPQLYFQLHCNPSQHLLRLQLRNVYFPAGSTLSPLQRLYLPKEMQLQLVMPNTNCLIYSLCQLGTAKPSPVRGVGDMPQLEDKASPSPVPCTLTRACKTRVENPYFVKL